MGVVVSRTRLSPTRGERRAELVECLPGLRDALERGRTFRVEQLASMAVAARARGGEPTPADLARAEVDELVVVAARRALADIDRALTAIRTGRYGWCESCGEEIALEVLRVVPQARLCLSCHHRRPRGAERRDGVGVAHRPPTTREPDGRGPDAQRRRAALDRTPRGASAASAACSESADGRSRTIWVRQLLGRPVVGPDTQHLGHVRDVAVRWAPGLSEAAVTGLVADLGGVHVFVPPAAIRQRQGHQVLMHPVRLRELRDAHLADNLLLGSVLGIPVMTTNGEVARVADIGIRCTHDRWTVWMADTRSPAERFLGLPRRLIEWRDLVGRRLAQHRSYDAVPNLGGSTGRAARASRRPGR